MDALDRPVFRRFNRIQKMEFAKAKREEELKQTLEDPRKVRSMARGYEETIRKQKEDAFRLKGII